ncbi:MAG: protein kinase [Sphingomonadales bacterium]
MTKRDVETERAALDLVEAALELEEADRRDFIDAASEPSAVRKRALDILFSASADKVRIETQGADAYTHIIAETPKQLGSYRVLEEVGRGGMGTVYLAQRVTGDFDHQVAIKVIATGTLSPDLVERFKRERQTLAQLNHPNIARLYDGGETEDGLPYLVMEFVKGQPLNLWLEDEPSEASRFAIMQQILAAVSHAHRNLIIHRDLTPNNVVVSDEGAVKLIDFGISSFQSASRAPGASGQTATPGFAAPESGNSTLPSTLLDIFALGKLMRMMFPGNARPEILAIAQKASADEPDQRYATVRELAEDVSRYRSGRPVTAFEGGFGYRTAKYLKRNWLPVSAAAVISVVIAGSVTLLAGAYQKEQAARQLADSRFKDVRTLAGTMMFDVYDAINAIPNTVEARQLVARKSIDYLNSLAITPDAPPDLRQEVGEGWLRLSQVTGGSSGDHIGLPEDASTFGARALDILEDLHADYPENEDIQYALGRASAILALDSLYMLGDSETGYARAARAVALLTALDPSEERIATMTANAHRALGDAYGWMNELPKAGEAYSKGMAYVEALPPSLQNTTNVRLTTSPLMRQLAEVYRYTGKQEEALAQMRSTVAYTQTTLEQATQADAAAARRNHLIVLWNIADMSASVSQWESGLPYAKRAQRLIEEALAQNPGDVGWLELVPQVYAAVARLHSGMGAHTEAVAAADTAIDTLRTIRKKSGANAGADLSLATGWKDLAPVYSSAGRPDVACAGLREANEIHTAYDDAGNLSDYDRANNMAPVIKALDAC